MDIFPVYNMDAYSACIRTYTQVTFLPFVEVSKQLELLHLRQTQKILHTVSMLG